MKGVILGITLHDYKSEIKIGDLVCIDDEFYNIVNIDRKYNDKENNPFCYFVKSKINGELMNFERNEISKATLGIYSSELYFNDNKKIKLGNISAKDMTNIKYKAIIDYDLPTTEINNLKEEDLINLEFNGNVIDKEFDNYENPKYNEKYFVLS